MCQAHAIQLDKFWRYNNTICGLCDIVNGFKSEPFRCLINVPEEIDNLPKKTSGLRSSIKSLTACFPHPQQHSTRLAARNEKEKEAENLSKKVKSSALNLNERHDK